MIEFICSSLQLPKNSDMSIDSAHYLLNARMRDESYYCLIHGLVGKIPRTSTGLETKQHYTLHSNHLLVT